MADETSVPTVDELTAKGVRLAGDVDEAEAAYGVAVQTFGDAAKSDPTAIESLLELSTAVAAAKATVTKAKSAVSKVQTDIDGIQYDERMAVVTEASLSIRMEIEPAVKKWFKDNGNIVDDFAIDNLTMIAKREPSGATTISVKPSGENMPKRPSSKRASGNGERGPRSTRNVTVVATGETLSCRDYVKACGDRASPAAQADLAGEWDGSPVSYTNEAKRLAAKTGDTFN